jgi:predicted alpha/beta superfamily hydrolase
MFGYGRPGRCVPASPQYNARVAHIRRAKQEGRLRLHPRFASRFLSTPRDLVVYLPPGYEPSGARHPVFYLQDGQNLFDPATAFGGQDWRADVTADEMICRGEIEPVILVGIYNTGTRRVSEYTPTRNARLRKGGKAGRYAEMLAREIKPFIDHEYRTLKSARHTAVGGSSLGALASLIAALEYPRVFGQVAMLSPSVWWDGRSILAEARNYRSPVRPRIWLDVGTKESDSAQLVVEEARLLRDALIENGWRLGPNLEYREIEGAVHSETAWAARFGDVLAHLFGGRK